jgi:hypothetical protein
LINLAIGILWLIIGIIVLGAVVYILLWAIRTFVPGGLSARIEQAIWAVFGVLILIYLLSVIGGGGGLPHPLIFRE